MVKLALEKQLETASKASGWMVNLYFLLTLLVGIATKRSLKQLWTMLDYIQLMVYLKFLNYEYPWMIYGYLEGFTFLILQD